MLAMVLGDRTEDAFRQSMLLSGGKLSVFVSTPLVGVIMALALACLLVPIFSLLMHRRNAACEL